MVFKKANNSSEHAEIKEIIMIKFLLIGLLCISAHVSSAQSQPANNDSLLFVQAKSDFIKFEAEHGHYIQTKNVSMHYLSWGKPTGIPFVWVHGTHSNAYELYGFADSLVNQGYYVIAIDYYGHGLTPLPAKQSSLYHVADDIKFLLDFLKIKKTVIGGWSRGGSIATAFYDAYPGSVSGIILEDGGSVAWATMDHRQSIDSATAKFKKEFQEFAQYAPPAFTSEFEATKAMANLKNKGLVYYALAKVKRTSNGKFAINPEIADLTGENSIDDFLTIFYRPFAAPQLFGVSTELVFPKIIYRNLDVPMLILDPVSENDQFQFEEANAQLQKEHPSLITHKIYKNTSHGLKFQRPLDFQKDVKDFLARVKSFKKAL